MKQKKIIIWHSSICKIGGVETFLYNWCLQLRNYYDITVLYNDADSKQLNRLKRIVNIIQNYPNRNTKYECDICVRNSVWSVMPDIVAKDKRYIEMKHANYKYLKDTNKLKDQYIPDDRITEHVSCGEFVSKMVKEAIGVESTVIENILAPKVKPNKIYRFVTCARINDKEKGWERMKIFMQLLRNAQIKFEFIIFSDPPEIELPEEVKVYKPRLDIIDYVASADYVVLLSDSEGRPYTVAEALQYGVPCIVTDVGGCTELIKDGVNGYVVPLNMNFNINKIKKIPKVKAYEDKSLEKWLDYLGGAAYMEKKTVKSKKVEIIPKFDYTDVFEDKDVKEGTAYKTTEERAEYIVANGYAKYVE